MPTRASINRYARGLEAEVAYRLGGVRVRSRERKGTDVMARGVQVQCKRTTRWPAWVDLELRALEAHTPTDERALLVVGGPSLDDPLVIQHLSQYVSWHVGENTGRKYVGTSAGRVV